MKTSTQPTSSDVMRGNNNDIAYDHFLNRMNKRFLENCDNGKRPLFVTDAEGLWEAYLDSFATAEERQYHNCHCCRRFIESYGSLVTIGDDGRTTSATWNPDDAPDDYKPAIEAMARLVRRAKVKGVFLSSERVWGTPETGVWHHLAIEPQPSMIYKNRLLTAFQASAAKTEDFGTMMLALNEFDPETMETALTLLRSDALYRSEKVLGQAEWLHGLGVARKVAKGDSRTNIVWLAVALAPAGFCHPRSSMIGTLLEDIVAGMDFDDVSRRFAAKMHPLNYQRPQTDPTAGAIAEAEKLVEKMGIARSLPRRFARLDEIKALWKPVPEKDAETTGGVFSHLKPKGPATPEMKIPAQVMTWDKFQRTILPTAEQIEFCAPSVGSYTSLVTAVNADAPPILQWDSEDERNSVSWYFYNGGSTASQFGLFAGKFHKVNAITLKPSLWNGKNNHHGYGVMFVIDGARESKIPGACLFPEILKAELHGVRSVFEAYSRNAKMEGESDQSAAGIMLNKGQEWNALVRVTANGVITEYKLDRWD